LPHTFPVTAYIPLPGISIHGRSNVMKVFTQAKNESVIINDEIIVTVLDVNEDEVILEVDAPEWVAVCEEETLGRSESMPGRPR
jgi:carbon storage regulator CsrA